MADPASSANLKLKDIPSLNQQHCKIKDPERVEKIINEFKQGGVKKLQVLSDYDFTLTKQGTGTRTSFDIVKYCKSTPPSFVENYNKLFNEYNPINIDPRIPFEEKKRHMIDWWTKSGNLLVGFELKQEEIDEISVGSINHLRDRTHELFQNLNRLNVPVLVFSAGLGNVVESVLRQSNILYSNVKVISNFLQYKGDLLNGLKEPIIHAFNKNETALEGTEYYDLVHSRDHIIVMGDSIADAGMAEGVPSSSHLLKIGFLFDHVEENLQKYMDAFDIVLVDDQTMDVPRALLEIIENK